MSASRIVQWVLLAGMFLVAFLLYPILPAHIPSHWGLNGIVDGWMPKTFGVFMMPVIALTLTVLLPLLERVDPKRKNYAAFADAWNFLQFAMTAFFFCIFILQMIAALHPVSGMTMTRVIVGGTGLLFACIGSQFDRIRLNYFVGVRTPWTLSSERVWDATHALAKKVWVLAGTFIVVVALLVPEIVWAVFIGSLLVAVVVPITYSYVLFRKRG